MLSWNHYALPASSSSPVHCLQWQVRFETFSPLTLYNFTATARNSVGWGSPSNTAQFLAPNVSSLETCWLSDGVPAVVAQERALGGAAPLSN